MRCKREVEWNHPCGRVHVPNDWGAVQSEWSNAVDDEAGSLDESLQLVIVRDVDADDCDI